MNFNADQNNGKEKIEEVEEYVEYEDYEEEYEEATNISKSSSSNNPERKKLIRLLGLLLVVIIVFILVMILLTSLTGGKKSYEEIETIMSEAAESYFEDHKDNLPTKDGGTQTIDASVLSTEGYMKDLSKYTDDTCTGTVKVRKSGGSYFYTPNLNCGDAYASTQLTDKVRKDNSIVTSGYGLYNKNGNYVFRGETVNNFVQLDNALWRIVKITSGNNIVLVLNDGLVMTSPWDNRYNSEANYKSGINNYTASRIKENLLQQYNDEESFLSDNDKSKTVPYNLCVGKRSLTTTGVEQAVECKQVASDQNVGLLTAADYMNASVDSGCKNISSKTCQNYNYLNAKSIEWWTATASTTNTHTAYLVTTTNGIKEAETYTYARIRPVVYLNSNVLYKSGTGTESDPYIVK